MQATLLVGETGLSHLVARLAVPRSTRASRLEGQPAQLRARPRSPKPEEDRDRATRQQNQPKNSLASATFVARLVTRRLSAGPEVSCRQQVPRSSGILRENLRTQSRKTERRATQYFLLRSSAFRPGVGGHCSGHTEGRQASEQACFPECTRRAGYVAETRKLNYEPGCIPSAGF